MARASRKVSLISAIAGAALLFATVPSAAFAQDAAASGQTAPAPEKHHGLLKGAAVGAVGGHFVGKGHAKSGAAVGALVQHHKNKKAEKAAAKGE
jgi:hypothetical protein